MPAKPSSSSYSIQPLIQDDNAEASVNTLTLSAFICKLHEDKETELTPAAKYKEKVIKRLNLRNVENKNISY
jgi:hypothetical protein